MTTIHLEALCVRICGRVVVELYNTLFMSICRISFFIPALC
jgi:hypothetical protein